MPAKKLLPALLFFVLTAQAQNNYRYNPFIDVQHYEYRLKVSDANDTLYGTALVTIQFMQPVNQVTLDLANINAAGKGMILLSAKDDDKATNFSHNNGKAVINLVAEAKAGDTKTIEVNYKGVPTDGLIISTTRYNKRSFFSDNWPNRAHNWIACVDHLSDKATVTFVITAPDHYQVVCNGIQTEISNLPDHFRLTRWEETTPIATKVMALGVADFAVNYVGNAAGGIPIYSWVFPENREQGFYDYAQAKDIVSWFVNQVGPYPFRKLANVQSKTTYGGLENAGAIFYAERSVTGTRKSEGLLAHEIAHQWFGNSATETHWPHLWLSEGFATYMTDLYLEHIYGLDSLNKGLRQQRKQVTDFAKKTFTPVIDTAVTDYMKLLNANSYQKGGWVLHMLRRKIGDDLFWKSVRNYYDAFKGKNASTPDLINVFEKTTGAKLESFFRQWLYQPGHPVLAVNWQYNAAKKAVEITVTQQQAGSFEFPLELGWTTADKQPGSKVFNIKDKTTTLSIPAAQKPESIVIDPNTQLLFEGVVTESK